MIFLDTNILLYAGSNAGGDAVKKRIASDLIASGEFVISTQVVQEFIANALGKKELGLTEANVRALLEHLDAIVVVPVTVSLVRAAWQLRSRFGLSHWDAAIVAAAQELQCEALYTEDLNHGQVYDGVRVVNPFR